MVEMTVCSSEREGSITNITMVEMAEVISDKIEEHS